MGLFFLPEIKSSRICMTELLGWLLYKWDSPTQKNYTWIPWPLSVCLVVRTRWEERNSVDFMYWLVQENKERNRRESDVFNLYDDKNILIATLLLLKCNFLSISKKIT